MISGDAVVLAAGGIGTAQIMRRASGIAPSGRAVGGPWSSPSAEPSRAVGNCRSLPWSGSPRGRGRWLGYLDVLSHWFHRPWRNVGLSDRAGVMVKLAEAANGKVLADGSVEKPVDEEDQSRLQGAAEEVREMMERAGVRAPYVNGLLHGGHLRGTVPLQSEDVGHLMHPSILPEGLWVADLSLLPRSQGLPTMLTTAALALRVSRRIE